MLDRAGEVADDVDDVIVDAIDVVRVLPGATACCKAGAAAGNGEEIGAFTGSGGGSIEANVDVDRGRPWEPCGYAVAR